MSKRTPDHLPSFSRFLRRKLGGFLKPLTWLAVLAKPVMRLAGRLVTRRRTAIVGGLLAAFIILTPVVTYGYFARTINDRERIMNHKQTGVILKDRHGEVFYRQGNVTVDDLKLDAISDHVERATIASEDREFYTHDGFSFRGIAAALYANILDKDATRYGGSTITQQLVKNKLLSSEKSFVRKYQEVSMAVAIETKYSKDDILEMYLNSVYFGEGAFGIKDAARTYFNKSPADLDLAESALLVGLLPAPNQYSPISGNAEKAAAQQQRVLDNMVENGIIDAAERDAAVTRKLAFAPASETETFKHAQHYALMVLEQLGEKYGEERVSRAGFEVTTSLDLNRQKEAERIVERRVASFEHQGGRNASLVAINPRTGEVEALVGSVDWSNQSFGKVNMALAARQPGSSFKPIYYSEAIDRGLITAATVLKDEKKTFGDWAPENYDFRYRGNISVRDALALSLNIPAAEVMQKLGPDEAAQAARRMGISTVTEPERYGLTLALGTAETKLYEMTNAYAGLANQGLQHTPVLYSRIIDKYDKTVFELPEQEPERMLSAEASYVMSSILSDNTARAPTFGSSLTVPGRPAAVKTGTTNENKDAWTIGYTPNLAVGVWVGNNENQPMYGLAGSSSAGLIWRDSMMAFLADKPRENFERPAGVVDVLVCRGSGERAIRPGTNAYTEVFMRAYPPRGVCAATKQEEKREQKEEKKPDNGREEDRGNADRERAPDPVPTPVPAPAPVPETALEDSRESDEGGRGSGGDDEGDEGGGNSGGGGGN